jgi:3-dehydroquinate dehydratase / shikimate dehydrogenase
LSKYNVVFWKLQESLMSKICVSVCAKTAEDLIEQIKRAEEFADVIEIRFDCLNQSESDDFLRRFDRKEYSSLFLTTFRATEQGGNQNLSFTQREDFWLHTHIFEFTDWADIEEDISAQALKNLWGDNVFAKFIKSAHDFNGVPNDLSEIYERLKATYCDVIKLAVQTENICDTISIWKLLERAKSENKDFIPIAMSEAGKWTRILGLAHGAFMTYASLDSGSETAPGQISAADLRDVYRVKNLNKETEVYGILGSNTSVSMSPYMHNAAFEFHNLNAVFVPLQVIDLDEFIRRMVKPETREIDLNFRGFSVTMPHKQSIIRHLDFIDETAKAIGAVNTVKIVDRKLHGFNTDAKGFIDPLLNSYGDLKDANVAVFGAGGASKACVYALEKEGANVTVFGRSEMENGEWRMENFRRFDIVVNATPIGMKGKFQGEAPVVAEQIENVKLVYDLVYNPFQTQLMNEADKVHVPKIGGIAMLIAQAMEQQKIWTGKDAPMKEMSREILARLK